MSDKIYTETTAASEQIYFLIQYVTQNLNEKLQAAVLDAQYYRQVAVVLAVFFCSFIGIAKEKLNNPDKADALFQKIIEVGHKKDLEYTLETIKEVFETANMCGIYVDYSMTMNYELYLRQKALGTQMQTRFAGGIQ